MEEYEKAIHAFRKVYVPLKKKYKLYMNAHMSLYDDNTIEIYKREGQEKIYIIKLKEEEIEVLYNRALQELLRFDEKENGRKNDEAYKSYKKRVS